MYEKELIIAYKLAGLTDNHNKPQTKHPVFHYLPDLLRQYNLTPTEAQNILLQMTGAFPPSVRDYIIPKIVDYLKQVQHTKIKKKPVIKTPPETLIDIWEADRSGNKTKMYSKYIDYLKQEYMGTASPFVTEINNKLQWNEVPKSGWQQYAKAFIYTCIKNKLIADKYSSTDLQKIFEKTFSTKPHENIFKSISTNPPKEKYLKPFSTLPANI